MIGFLPWRSRYGYTFPAVVKVGSAHAGVGKMKITEPWLKATHLLIIHKKINNNLPTYSVSWIEKEVQWKKSSRKLLRFLNSFKFTSFAISGSQANVRFSIHSGNDARWTLYGGTVHWKPRGFDTWKCTQKSGNLSDCTGGVIKGIETLSCCISTSCGINVECIGGPCEDTSTRNDHEAIVRRIQKIGSHYRAFKRIGGLAWTMKGFTFVLPKCQNMFIRVCSVL